MGGGVRVTDRWSLGARTGRSRRFCDLLTSKRLVPCRTERENGLLFEEKRCAKRKNTRTKKEHSNNRSISLSLSLTRRLTCFLKRLLSPGRVYRQEERILPLRQTDRQTGRQADRQTFAAPVVVFSSQFHFEVIAKTIHF